MADNSTLPANGDIIADEDIGGVKYQRIKLIDATVGSTSPIGTAASPLPVSLATVPSHAVTNAGTFAVQAAQSGTWNIGSITTLPALAAGSALVGKFGIDQTTPGTTNAVSVPDLSTSGSLASLNATLTLAVTNCGSAAIEISGTWVGTITFEASLGGTVWTGINATAASTSTPSVTTTVNGLYRLSPAGVAQIRANMSAFTSGSATIAIRSSVGGSAIFANQILPTKNFDGTNTQAIKAASTASAFTDQAAVVDIRPGAVMPVGAALADAFANWTATQIAAGNLLFNGTSWDRQRGMSVATTTGDTGAKTATGNGATITNVGNKGMQVVIVLGAVSGTTPTCVFKLQTSVDAGTTWVDIPGAATASLTATGNFGVSVYPGQAVTAGTTTTNTTATANGVIARTWRVVWTIGGTTPSFTITSITYNYLPN